jgi:hypothetical protein
MICVFSISLPLHLPFCLTSSLSVHISAFLYRFLPMLFFVFTSACLSTIHKHLLHIHLPSRLSICLSVSVYLSTHLDMYLWTVLPDREWQAALCPLQDVKSSTKCIDNLFVQLPIHMVTVFIHKNRHSWWPTPSSPHPCTHLSQMQGAG